MLTVNHNPVNASPSKNAGHVASRQHLPSSHCWCLALKEDLGESVRPKDAGTGTHGRYEAVAGGAEERQAAELGARFRERESHGGQFGGGASSTSPVTAMLSTISDLPLKSPLLETCN